MSQRTVYLIGLDGIPPRLLDEAIEKGHTPTLEELGKTGVKGTTKTVIPPLSMAAWSSFATGRDLGGHGIFNFMLKQKGSYNTQFANGSLLHEYSIPYWDYLDANGLKTGVMNLMPGYPPSESAGFHIGDLVTSPPDGNYMYPPDLNSEIEENVNEYLLYPYSSYTPDKSERALEQYIEDLFDMEKNRSSIGKYLIQNKDCDVFNFVFSGSDSIQHCLAHIQDSDHPRHEPELMNAYAEKPLELLEIYDEFLNWLQGYADPEDVIIVLSDHGHSSVYSQLNLNSWLYNEGYLNLESNSLTQLKAFGYNHLFDVFESVLHKLGLFSKVKSTVAQSGSSDPEETGNRNLKDLLTISSMDYDWDETAAFTIASGGQIYLNTSEEHPAGWITKENYDEIRESLKDDLLDLEHPETGEKVIDSVYYGEEIYSDTHAETRPDLAVLPKDNYQIQYPQTMKTQEVFSTPPKPGSHTSETDRTGIFLATGGGAGGSSVEVDITDYAPTLMALLGLPVPDSMTGQVRTDVFDIDPTRKNYDGRVVAKRAVRNTIQGIMDQ
ncbi:alkaline phosphatase family protein [Haloarcula sp. S1AR25-5A]|uniref:Alkaline phosphatase family protein n=1 Tax=Haloarcula terrestris TaxID=2950533 RepID=A0AAE4EY32_9EURY|nr:alkaline phosphatase family protein [Haloarcula terrestris]MDS0221684.1 alkaline phosphatase family protein [Haloarcula terrestris]